VAEQGRPAARKGQTLASEQLGWGLDSPSVDWWGRFGRKRLLQRLAARKVAVGRDGRNACEKAVRPANARAREVPGVRVEVFVVCGVEEGGGWWGAPARYDRRRRRARRGGSELRPSECGTG
jgi:hypothetical protein